MMIGYDEQGGLYLNVFLVLIMVVVIVLNQGIGFLMNRARAKKERRERRERNLTNAVVALNRHAVVVDKAIKRLKKRGLR